jgi:hypothetical protein
MANTPFEKGENPTKNVDRLADDHFSWPRTVFENSRSDRDLYHLSIHKQTFWECHFSTPGNSAKLETPVLFGFSWNFALCLCKLDIWPRVSLCPNSQ